MWFRNVCVCNMKRIIYKSKITKKTSINEKWYSCTKCATLYGIIYNGKEGGREQARSGVAVSVIIYQVIHSTLSEWNTGSIIKRYTHSS